MKNATIARIFTLQGAFNGVLGATIGGVLGTLLTANLNTLTSIAGINLLGVPSMGLPIEINPFKVCVILLFAVVLSLLASIYPAKKAASLKPADVLRYE
ncbi:FtsX-like permease family protein [Psychrosphaera algicola]|uniref:FtsX-like permease family protein n=1 Tax=Psychrosphaera algicola TaxID=3023714 RepID=A0ABT5F946_9GAMM|nr:FtsX-like permease family protein [Psychrosphaera sp. G1-22]MDC2888040.1 FtsX-like permease family protein [Psychrosphaera sp. G1-22]